MRRSRRFLTIMALTVGNGLDGFDTKPFFAIMGNHFLGC